MVAMPDWVRLPDTASLDDNYPAHAKELGMPGGAVLRCEVRSDGGLGACVVGSEAPIGEGFGAATLKLAKHFRLKPMMLDGRPVEGAVVQVPVRWTVSDGASLALGGEIGIILTVLQDPKDAKPGAKALACPTADNPSRKCQAHLVSWEDSPSAVLLAQVMEQNKLVKGSSRLICTVSDDKSLSDCAVAGAATAQEEAAMRTLAAHLRPMSTTDQTPIAKARMIVLFDWTEITAELKRAARKHS